MFIKYSLVCCLVISIILLFTIAMVISVLLAIVLLCFSPLDASVHGFCVH